MELMYSLEDISMIEAHRMLIDSSGRSGNVMNAVDKLITIQQQKEQEGRNTEDRGTTDTPNQDSSRRIDNSNCAIV